jgi:hypothetical protein
MADLVNVREHKPIKPGDTCDRQNARSGLPCGEYATHVMRLRIEGGVVIEVGSCAQHVAEEVAANKVNIVSTRRVGT